MDESRVKNRMGWGLGLVALLVYAAQIPGYVFPNEWAMSLYSVLGLDPFRPLSRPVWQLLMSGLGAATGAQVGVAAAVLNAVFGALAVVLVYHLGYRLRRPPALVRTPAEAQAVARTRRVAGLVSGGFLIAAAPVMVVATRVHPLALDLCLLLGAALLFFSYRDQPRPGSWWGFMVLYGIGVAEFATFILLGPVFLVGWIWLFWRTRTFRAPRLLGGLALGLAGASVGALFCWIYAQGPVAAWRGFEHTGTVYYYFLLEQYQQIRYTVPKHGWLIVLLTMVMPAVFILWNGFEEADDLYTNIGLISFRVVLLGVGVLILFNLPGSPWRVLGPSVALVTPYAITALWFGQLVSFFHEKAVRPPAGRLRPRPVSPWPARAVLGAAALVLVTATALNAALTSPRQAAPVIDYARDVLDGAGDADYLVTNGRLDAAMHWLVLQEGRTLRLIDRNRAGSGAYMKYLATWFDDPQMESMAEVGLGPFIDVWMSAASNITQSLVIQDVPEFWTMQGYVWIPSSGVYRGGPLDTPATTYTSRIDQSRAFLARHEAVFGAAASPPDLLGSLHEAVGRQLAVFANNLGFVFAGQEAWDDAVAAYETALRYDPDNLSALINLAEAARRQGRAEDATRYAEAYRKRVEAMAVPMPPRRLAALYGQVRNPVALMQQGMTLLQSGLTESGINRLQDAMAFQTDDRLAGLTMAQALFESGRIRESHEQFAALAEQQPGDTRILLGLARCQLLLGKTTEAEASFARLQDLGLPPEQLNMERGFALLRAGLPADALRLFLPGLTVESVSGPSAIGVVLASAQTGDNASATRAVEVLKARPNYFAGQMILYEVAFAARDIQFARESLLHARRLQPGNPEVLEKLIQVELLDGREQPAKLLLDRLLEVDSANAYGNYLLAGVHEKNGRLDLAEAALNRALPRDTRGDAAYGLAWILEKQGRYDEALAMADLALTRQPDSPQFLAVKGIVLGSRGDTTQAIDLLQQAIARRTDREIPLFQLHLARVHVRAGDQAAARAILDTLAPRRNEATEEESELWAEIEQALAEDT